MRSGSSTFLIPMEGGAYAEMYEQEDVHWWFRGRRALIKALLRRARVLESLPPEPRLLDAGCGTGRNLVEFGSLGTASGVDAFGDAVEFCRKRGLDDVQCAGLEALPFEAGEFHLLFACDVIEHVEDDSLALRELHRVAAVGANLVITSPAYQWMWSDHDIQLHHFRRYTLGSMRARACAAGWTVVHETYFNSLLFPLAAVARLASRLLAQMGIGRRSGHTDLDRTPALFNSILELPLKIEAAFVARGGRLPAGVSVGLVCRKET